MSGLLGCGESGHGSDSGTFSWSDIPTVDLAAGYSMVSGLRLPHEGHGAVLSIRSIDRDFLGNFLISDNRSKDVKLVDSDGQAMLRFGRSGAGPGAASVSSGVLWGQSWQWQRPNYAVRRILRAYYGGTPTGDGISQPDCLAERGDRCFGGDPEDQLCTWVPACRSVTAQSTFLQNLKAAPHQRPDDGWAVAQSAYAFLRLDQPTEALEIAHSCATVEWWCMLVRGLVLQRTGDATRAEAEFRQAVDRAAPDLACRLRDISPLLDGADRKLYHAQPCESRDSLETWFWWLSDPLFTRPGNDRFSEHVARRFAAVLHEEILAAQREHHTDAHELQLVRWGAEDSYRTRPHYRFTSRRAARYHFVPQADSLFGSIDSLRYRLETSDEVEGFTPTYGPFVAVPVQFVRFRQGDSTLVVGATDLSGVSTKTWFDASVVLVLSDGPERFRMVSGANTHDATLVFASPIGGSRSVASVEVTAPDGTIGRHRRGLAALSTTGFGVSDILLYAATTGTTPGSRRVAIASMLGATDIEFGHGFGIYWEVYGAVEGEPITRRIEIEGQRPGLLARILGLNKRSGLPSALSWVEAAGEGVDNGVFDLDLSTLEPGMYTLRLILSTRQGETAETSRRFRIVGP